MDVASRLKKIIAENLGVLSCNLRTQSRISELEGDSLDKLETVIDIENEFGISLSDEEVGNFLSVMTIKEIAALIEEKIIAKSKNPKSQKPKKIPKKD